MAHKVVNGVVVELTDEEIRQINDSVEAVAIAQAKDWKFNRRAAYDSLNQDEMRYDDLINSTTTWQDAIAAIKQEYPK